MTGKVAVAYLILFCALAAVFLGVAGFYFYLWFTESQIAMWVTIVLGVILLILWASKQVSDYAKGK